MDIGSTLADTMRYQSIHEELINKLKVNNVLIVVFTQLSIDVRVG